MLDDDNVPPPQLQSPLSPVRKDGVTTIPLEQSPDQRADSDSPTKSATATVPGLDPIFSSSSESSTKPVKKKDNRPLPANSTEQEQTQRVNLEKAEDSADLKAQIQRLNDRLREFEDSGRTKKGPETEDLHPDEDLDFAQWEGISGLRANESLGGLPLHRNRRPKAHEEMIASGTLMAELEFNARMEARREARQFHFDNTCDLDEESEEEPEEASEEDTESNAVPLNTSQLNYVTWETFQRLRKRESPFAIDVLVGEPEPKVTSMFPGFLQPTTGGRARRGAQAAQAKEGSAVPLKKTPTIPAAMPSNHAQRHKMPGKPVARGPGPLPERIRINSPAILKLLDKISGMRDGDESESDKSDSGKEDVDTPDPVLMMRPFRALVYYKDEIRNWKERLEANVKGPVEVKISEPEAELGKEIEPEANDRPDVAGQEGETSKTKSDDAGSEPEDQPLEDEKQSFDPILSTKEAVDDITCLVEFIDNELEGRIAYLESNDCQRVAFSDIWLLFKPGDFVLSKDGKQAYRVISAEHSKHSMKLPSPRDFWMYGAKARLEDFPIKIQCVYVDFDGEQIGPVLQTFSFYRFEGEKNIRSLDIIPLRLAKNATKLQETLIKRGSTFIEACGTGRHGIPMHYSGLTLDTKEEVDSQVVLDFEEAFAVHDGNKRNTKRSGMTTEQLILEILAQEMKDDIKKKGQDLIVLHDSENWKPVIKDIDIQNDEVDDGNASDYSDSDSDRPRAKNLKCIPECCANEIVYDDTYAEHRRSNEFIQDQFREQGTGSLAISSRPLKESMEDKDFIRDSERLIITYRVFGFIMRSRKWAQLDLTYLGPAKGENTFDLLVLPPGHRNMVESLVTQHYLDKASASDETDEMDIVRGKGKGLIILLHGAPGVGKTTTAECVATYFQKPLFQITCGDLGSTADVVERRLETNFALASRWGCILLIDEADVFLEARQTENFDRNSLVAVFLRTLEYYTGILFLTTNRVGTFDEAFTSRIHISLYYPPLDAASTLAVFQVNLDRIKERFRKKKQRGVAELELDERSINKFILNYYARNEEARWNGRQIRNACQTALALAEFEAQKAANPGIADGRSVMNIAAASSNMIKVQMTAKHFRDVAKAYLAFMKYLKEVHGMSAAQQARSFRLRHDRYGLGEPFAGSGLLASRQRGNAGGSSGGVERQRKPVQKQGLGKRGTQPPSLRVNDRYTEEDFGEYEYGEEDLYEEDQEDDAMRSEGEEEEDEVEEDYEDEQEEDLEDEGDDADFGAPEDEQSAEEDEDEYWDERLQENNEYLYEAQPKARPQPVGSGRGSNLRGRGQQQTKYKMTAAAHPRTDGISRGRGVATAAGRSSGLQTKVSRGNHPPLGSGRGRGIGTAARGRSPRLPTRHE